MVAKNIKAKSFAACVRYVLKKDAEMLKAEGVMELSADSMITSFELQRSVRPEIKSPVGHIPISFAPEDRDRMTNEFMAKLAEEYMQSMGTKETQYIIVRHHDGSNEHLHIVYNRIDNNSKLISDKNDYKRNVATCKKLKDRYNLTYGKNKMRVDRDKLRGADKVKYEIHDAVCVSILATNSLSELPNKLQEYGINMEFKYRRGSGDIQGVSLAKDGYRFKGSQIDRKFSIRGIQKLYEAKTAIERKKTYTFIHRIPTKLGGLELTSKQRITLDKGKAVYLENVIDSQGRPYNLWAKFSERDNKINFYKHNPDHPQQHTQSNDQAASQHTASNQQNTSQHTMSPTPPQTNHPQSSDTSLSSSLSLFDLPTNGDDPEETQFRNRMQRQQKKRGRRM